MINSESRGVYVDRRTIEGFVPYFLDRLHDQARLIDQHSLHYLDVLITSYLAKELEVVQEEKAEVGTAETADTSKELETAAGNVQEENVPSIENADNTQSNANAADAVSEEPGSSGQGVLEVAVPLTGVSHDSTTIETEPMLPANSEPQLNEAAETESTPVDPKPVEGQSSAQSDEIQQQEGQQEQQQRDPCTMEDFRAILGDIEIPEGVDPAFLAALPDEYGNLIKSY